MPWISSTNEKICKKQLAQVRKHWATYSKFWPPPSHTDTHFFPCVHTQTHTHPHGHCPHSKKHWKGSWGDGSFSRVSVTQLCGPEFDPWYQEKPHEEKGLTATYMALAWTDVLILTNMHIQHSYTKHACAHGVGGGERREKEERGEGGREGR